MAEHDGGIAPRRSAPNTKTLVVLKGNRALRGRVTAMMPNSGEIAYWDGAAGSRWAALQERIDRAFAPLNAAGLSFAGLQAAEAVLDIGCGCGGTLVELAAAVGPKGSVLGVDISRSMLAVAQQRAVRLGLDNVRCVLADASTHAFGEDAFDLVFSRFGVMFFDDPIRAFANLRRSLRPDGRLVFLSWRELAANPWFYVPAEAIRPHVAPQPERGAFDPGPLAFADPDRVRGILEQAGFDGVQFHAFDTKLPLGPHAAATDLLSQIGPAAELFAGADEGARTSAKRELDRALRTHEMDGNILLGAGVWIVSARPAARR